MSSIAERLKEVRKEQFPKMTQASFAEATKVTRDAYSVYEIGRVIPSDAYLQVVSTTFGICFDWLKFGIDPKYQADQDDSAASLVPELVEVLDKYPPILHLMKKAAINMTAADWERLAQLIDSINDD